MKVFICLMLLGLSGCATLGAAMQGMGQGMQQSSYERTPLPSDNRYNLDLNESQRNRQRTVFCNSNYVGGGVTQTNCN
jgi:starvation-inducible outer membrane lipoprotein